jgi:uncharacterized protein with HEPN domain
VPPRSWRLRIEDILESIEKIERYSFGLSFEEFRADDKTFDAVARNFGIIGEAARHVPAEIADRHPDIPWSHMRGMRNIVVHEYFGADAEIMWETLRTEFPIVVPLLRRMLDAER